MMIFEEIMNTAFAYAILVDQYHSALNAIDMNTKPLPAMKALVKIWRDYAVAKMPENIPIDESSLPWNVRLTLQQLFLEKWRPYFAQKVIQNGYDQSFVKVSKTLFIGV